MSLFFRIDHVLYGLAVIALFSLVASATYADREVVFNIVYNGPNPNYSFDHPQDQSAVKSLTKKLSSMKVPFAIRTIEIEDLNDLVDKLLADLNPGEKIRGINFFGHGNEKYYAISADQLVQGWNLVMFLDPLLQKAEILSSQLTFYFHACNTANLNKGESFQESFYKALKRALPESFLTEVDVVAHSYVSMGPVFGKPNWIDRFMIKSRLGKFFERYSMLLAPDIGAYSPKVMAIGTWLAGVLAAYAVPDVGVYSIMGGTGFISLSLLANISSGRYGRIVGSKDEHGFIHNLLKYSFTKTPLCEKSMADE